MNQNKTKTPVDKVYYFMHLVRASQVGTIYEICRILLFLSSFFYG